MTISGIVLRLDAEPRFSARALTALRSDGRLTLGQQHGVCIPAVLETTDAPAAYQAIDELSEIPGVLRIDVVFVEVEEPGAAAAGAPPLPQSGRA